MSADTSSTAARSGQTAGRWTLDAERSQVEFRVPHTWGLFTVVGTFAEKDGWLAIGEDGTWSMELTLQATSLDTRNRMRDEDLRSEKFFDVEQHPEVRFRSTGVEGSGERLRVTGELEAGGRSLAIEAETTVRRTGDEIELDATATVDQRELGMTHSPLGMVKTPSRLSVHAVLRPER